MKRKKTKILSIAIIWVSLICVLQGFAFPVSAAFKYQLLETLPGFYTQGEVMTDFPGLILAIYNFGIWTVGIAGLFMLVIGGFMYMASAGNNATITTAKKIITDALLGIVAAMGAYLILYIINPDLTRISIDFAPKMVIEEEEDLSPSQQPVTAISSSDMVARNGHLISKEFNTALDELQANKGIKAQVTSGLRTEAKQIELIKDSCGEYPVTREKKCRYPVCKLLDGTKSCPHTTGRAADIWAIKPGGGQAISMSQCLKDVPTCRNNPYQKALIEGLREKGFCVLSTEPWHFEKPKMSSKCTY